MSTELNYRIREAIALLNDAANQIYNIPGDRWQMASDVLEGVIANLEIEQSRTE
jgi:hypothetical protein